MKEVLRCPVCDSPLSVYIGGRNRSDGITLFCASIDKCKSNEQPIAFGRNEKSAYNTLVYKYGPKDKRKELVDEPEIIESTPEPTIPPAESKITKFISNE